MDLKLKFDKKLFHHYIIGVGIYTATAGEKAGKFFLKYRPVHFTNDDIVKVQYASMLSQDKLFKTSNSEAIEAAECEDLVSTLSSLKLSAAANQCTLHHFSSQFEMDEKDFENIVTAANNSNYFKDLLRSSRIGGANGK